MTVTNYTHAYSCTVFSWHIFLSSPTSFQVCRPSQILLERDCLNENSTNMMCYFFQQCQSTEGRCEPQQLLFISLTVHNLCSILMSGNVSLVLQCVGQETVINSILQFQLLK